MTTFKSKLTTQIKKESSCKYEGVRIMQEELYGSTYCQVMSCQWKARYVQAVAGVIVDFVILFVSLLLASMENKLN